LTGASKSFHRIALSTYAGKTTAALTASHNGEAEPMAAPISSIPVHHIKAVSSKTPTAREMPILIVFFLLEPRSIHLKSWIRCCELLKSCPLSISYCFLHDVDGYVNEKFPA